MAAIEIPCRVCEKGTLMPQRVHRMSGPAVVIGYILLVPSLLGILLSGVFLVLSWVGAASAASTNVSTPFILQQGTRELLRTTKVPVDLISSLEKGEPVNEASVNPLPSSQRLAIQQAETERLAYERAQLATKNAKAGAAGCLGGCGTIFGVGGMILSFIGGLIGWLLVMKKDVLKCGSCGSVVATS